MYFVGIVGCTQFSFYNVGTTKLQHKLQPNTSRFLPLSAILQRSDVYNLTLKEDVSTTSVLHTKSKVMKQISPLHNFLKSIFYLDMNNGKCMYWCICNKDEVSSNLKLIIFFTLTNSSYKSSLIIKMQQLKMKCTYWSFGNTK